MGANTIEITDTNFEAEVIKSNTPVLIDFWAAWCAPCRALAPTVDAIAEEYKGRVKVGKLDVDSNASGFQGRSGQRANRRSRRQKRYREGARQAFRLTLPEAGHDARR
jgi:thiol-disulfide isomerase/thioredoxin